MTIGLENDLSENKYDLYITLLKNNARHRAILDVLKDVEQLMSAPYDPEYLANWIYYRRNYHKGCLEAIQKRVKELETENWEL
jgi:hypothetical protein